ncbi:MAG: RIP metalloprotease RseP [Muribaculaceae bacterium]|nr:RIP metalloprotease RseP [Muribaculaceae bacterium]
METFFIKAAQLILAFIILVTIHEFGHYIFARIFGMRVSRFYLFFNPWFSIAKYDPRKGTVQLIAWTHKTKKEVTDTDENGETEKKTEVTEEPRALWTIKVGKPHPSEDPNRPTWRDTIYGLGWLPLGGYCAIDGMIDETTDAKKLSAEPEPWEFRAKKPWPRLMVMIAGVLFNFILAIVIYIGIAIHWGDRVIPFENMTEGVDFAPELAEAGFKNGDRLTAIDGEALDPVDDMIVWKLIQDGTKVNVIRDGRDTLITIPQGTTEKFADPDRKTPPVALRLPVYISKPVAGEGAAEAGMLEGDRVVKVGNDTTPSFTELEPALLKHADSNVDITVLRDGKPVTLNTHVNSDGKIGIQLTPPEEIFDIKEINYGFFESIPVGISKGVDRLTSYVSSLKLLFTKTGAQSIGGFGAIGDMYPDQWNWEKFWNLTAFLSVILAFMNILPIPALDGGHVLFTLYEIVTRRKPSEKFLEYAQMAGMAFLFLLLIYANANDIYRLIIK